jgi:hypothetical protein
MNQGSGPKTPDPQVQANAEASANRYNIVGPSGTQTWSQGGREVIGYDSKGKPQYGQQSTQTINLGESEQKQYDTRNDIAEQLLGGAQSQVGDFAKDPFSFNDEGHTAAQAQYQRQLDLLNPEFKKQDESFESRYANAGIPVGSEAYNDAMRQHENDKNFALTQAAQQSESTGAQLGLSERQQRYNELAAALGSQQLNGVQAFGTQAAPIDVAGAYQNANNAALAKYNAGASGQNAGIGAIGQLGSAAITQWSDERLKDDIEQVGELPTGEGVYEYSYKWEDGDGPKHTGVLAQEVERNYPDAVTNNAEGTPFKKVNYSRLIAEAMAA